MDRNKDGIINSDELIFWVRKLLRSAAWPGLYKSYVNLKIKLHPDNTYNAIDEAEHLIDLCDKNDDENLSPEEIIAETDLWFDSGIA